MGYQIKLGSTSRPFLFFLTSSWDHRKGVEGVSPTVLISKSGGAFLPPAGSVEEVGRGWYRVNVTSADTDTLGPLILSADADEADVTWEFFEVVSFDPDTTQTYIVSGLLDVKSSLDAMTLEQDELNTIIRQSTGTGARKVSITVSDDQDYVQDCVVRMAKNAETYVGKTNVQGKIDFYVNDGLWNIALVCPGYSFGSYSVLVDGDKSLSYVLSKLAIPLGSPGTVTGYLYCYDELGLPEPNVEFSLRLTKPAKGYGQAFDNMIRKMKSDANGLVAFTGLFPGAVYRLARGSFGVSVSIPTDVGDLYALPSFSGIP